MKSTSKKPRREAEKEAEKEFEEPEMNSDFESVSEGEDESDEDVSISNEPELGYQATDEHGKVTDQSSTSVGSICFQLRNPEVLLHKFQRCSLFFQESTDHGQNVRHRRCK